MARTYQSTVRTERAEENRARVVVAATESFCETGWVATTMAEVARRSGLTRQTVYQQFSGKLPLLNACIEAALRSDGPAVPVREQNDYRAMGVGDFEQRVRAGAGWLCAAHQRSAQIQHVLDQAAVTDPDAAQLLAQREQQRWDEVRWALGLVLGEPPSDAVVDALWWAASRDGWLVLTVERGWTPDQWQEWFARQLRSNV